MFVIGINATLVGECQKDKGVADKIAEGAFTTVFTSPEAALTPGMWRRCFTSGFFHDNDITSTVPKLSKCSYISGKCA
jgi:hypothetical protein